SVQRLAGPVGIHTSADLFAAIMSAEPGVNSVAQGYYANTDDRNRLAYDVPRVYQQNTFAIANRNLLQNNLGSPWSAVAKSGWSDRDLAEFYGQIALS